MPFALVLVATFKSGMEIVTPAIGRPVIKSVILPVIFPVFSVVLANANVLMDNNNIKMQSSL